MKPNCFVVPSHYSYKRTARRIGKSFFYFIFYHSARLTVCVGVHVKPHNETKNNSLRAGGLLLSPDQQVSPVSPEHFGDNMETKIQHIHNPTSKCSCYIEVERSSGASSLSKHRIVYCKKHAAVDVRQINAKYSVDSATGELFEDGASVGKLITGNNGAWCRLIDGANNIDEITRQRDQLLEACKLVRLADVHAIARTAIQQAITQAERGAK